MFKKNMVCLLFVVVNIFSISPYDELKENFKSQLYDMQSRWIYNKEVYYKIVEEFLCKSENTLEVCRYFKQKKNDTQFFKDTSVREYFNSLLIANAHVFNYFLIEINLYNYLEFLSVLRYTSWGEALIASIQKIKDQYDLKFDIQREAFATLELLIESNKEYYKNIVFYKRWWWHSIAFCLRKSGAIR